MEEISQHLEDNDIVVLTSQSTDPLTSADIISQFHRNGVATGSLYRIVSVEKEDSLDTVSLLQIQSYSGKPAKWKGEAKKETNSPACFWATPEEVANFFGGAGALMMATGMYLNIKHFNIDEILHQKSTLTNYTKQRGLIFD